MTGPPQDCRPVHCTSQMSVALHVTEESHESTPHTTLQDDPAHDTVEAHDWGPVQLISQVDASSQSIGCVHESRPQLTMHGTPGGQLIGNAHWKVTHSNVQVLPMQVPPTASQLLAPHCSTFPGPSGAGPSAAVVSAGASPGAVPGDGLYWHPTSKQIAIRYRTPQRITAGEAPARGDRA